MNSDLKKLQGAWNIASLEVDGKKLPENMYDGWHIVITGDQFESSSMGAVYRGKVTLDEKNKPKHFDITFTEGPEKGNTNYGIYRLDGDRWRLCLDTTGKGRPRSFVTKPGSGHAVETLERAPAGAKPAAAKKAAGAMASPAPAETVVRGTGPATEFEGEWAMVSGVMNGAAMDPSMVQWVKRITRGNQTTVTAGPQIMLKVEFAYDASKTPKTIDYMNLAGASKGKSQQGIYEFEGDTVKFCVAAPGKPRPAEFASKPGDGRTFTVWRKA